jgi:hypothetical protein
MQLLLPVNVFTLVHEKERHLRIMMRMQGLSEGVYYAVSYFWMVGMYCVFMSVFVAVGSSIGLKIFTLNSFGVQFVFYFIWGNLLASFSFYFASVQREARPAVLLAVIYVIISGFIANVVMVQYVEQGPPMVVNLMQVMPSFALFRGERGGRSGRRGGGRRGAAAGHARPPRLRSWRSSSKSMRMS